MKKYWYALCGAFLLSSLIAAPQDVKPSSGEGKGRTLQVQVDYSGSGKVDEAHKIYVVLWDSPSFRDGGAMPVTIKPTASKNGTVTFSDVQKVPAYVSAVYDPSGSWDGQSGPPPSGASLGMYSKSAGEPDPIDITPGKTSKVTLSFDDSFKMP